MSLIIRGMQNWNFFRDFADPKQVGWQALGRIVQPGPSTSDSSLEAFHLGEEEVINKVPHCTMCTLFSTMPLYLL